MLIHTDFDIEVSAILSSVAQARRWLEDNPLPELIFSDIELGDGLSFELFRDIDIHSPVIFCTAFDEYAIRAFESNSIDYLLKPIDKFMLQRSLEKYLGLKNHMSADTQIANNIKMAINQLEHSYKQTLLISYREKLLPIKVKDVAFFYSSGGTVSLQLDAQPNLLISYTLEQLEGMLDPNQFFRANRQFIVNRDYIKNIEYYFNRKLILFTKIEAPEKVIVSRTKAQAFLKWIER